MIRKLLHTITIVFAFTLSILNVDAQYGIAKGKVQGIEGVLPGATVSAGNKSVLTDTTGEFFFSLKPGNHLLIITHAGYNKITREIKIEEGNIHIADFIMIPAEQLGEVVMLGSRSLTQRSNLNTAVPVDAFASDDLINTGRTSLTQILNFAAPSLNASRELIYEAVTLRGLNPDQLLILVNSKRYHNIAAIDGIRGQLNKGSVGNDLNSIPFSAIEEIEILRDGAAAQYGSDAVAGVIDIRLKKTTENTTVQLHAGQYYEGDGENINLGINHGVKLNKKGFLNLSADARFRNHTYRGGKYSGTVYYPILNGYSSHQRDSIIELDNQKVKDKGFDRSYTSSAGNSKLKSLAILINSGYPIGNKTELFLMTVLNTRENIFIGAFGFPKNFNQVNTDLFPDGFKFQPIIKTRDISGIAGAKGETKNRWLWEYSSAYGCNIIDYYPNNTNNPSQYYTLGKNAPTKFYLGTLIYQQLTNNINFIRAFYKKNSSIKWFNLALGAEWRLENYQIKAGEEAAWQNYDSLGRKNAGVQFAPIMHPDNAVNKNRNVLGTYIDLEADFNEKLLLNLAGRYDYYTDFGGNLAGKVAVRYRISDHINLRGSLNNGFRAPSLQQRFYSSTSHSITNVGGRLVGITSGIFRNNSDIVNAFGVSSLQAEKSLNLNTGLTATILNRLIFTVDAYWIQIKNRIVQSGSFDRTNPIVDSILYNNNQNIQQLQFFSNAINTKTRGIDVVMSSNLKIGKGKLIVMLGANVNSTRLFGEIKVAGELKADSSNTNTLFGRMERMRAERGQPDHKIILSLNYKTGKFEFILRNTRFGNTVITSPSISFSNDPSYDEFFSPKIITDISINYSLRKWLTITAGANNVFDVYPDRLKNYENTGEGQFIYALEASPFGFNGGYYYMSMSFNF